MEDKIRYDNISLLAHRELVDYMILVFCNIAQPMVNQEVEFCLV